VGGGKLLDRGLIDVWDFHSFDPNLRNLLNSHGAVIEDYVIVDQENTRLIVHENASAHLLVNPHWSNFNKFLEFNLTPAMSERTIRAWHFTRLCDHEADEIKTSGIRISSTGELQRRLAQMTVRGLLRPDEAQEIYQLSPYHVQNGGIRLGMFWMTSFPYAVGSSGINWLVENWGGESVYSNLKDGPLATKLKQLGSARVLEVAVPLKQTKHTYSAAKAVVSAFTRTLSLKWDYANFDLTAYSNLPAKSVKSVIDLDGKEYGEIRSKYAAIYDEYASF
jgi:NAD(P)-dependent dehydrogenase (short-subunit alcohol dehydrogenase family)